MAILRSRVVQVSALALTALLLLLVWLPSTQWARQIAFARLRDALRQQDLLLEGGQFDYDLFGLRGSLTNFTVRAAHDRSLPPIATVKTARVALNWKTVSTLNLDVDSATISGLQLHLVIDQDGRTNLPQPPKISSKSSNWPIRHLIARDAALLVEDRQHHAALRLQPWTLTMAGRDLELLTTKPGELLYRGQRLALDQVSLSATLEADALRIKTAEISSGPSRLALSGRVDHFDTLDIQTKSTLDVASLSRFLAPAERLGGQVIIEAAATGEFQQLKVKGTVLGKQLAFGELSNVSLSAKASYDGMAQRIQVTDSNIESPYGTGNATADVALRSGESKLTARVERLDVERFARLAKATVIPAAQVSAALEAKWPALNYGQATGTATLRAKATGSEATPNRLPISADIALTGRPDQLRAEIRSLSAAGAEASGIVYLNGRRNLSGSLTTGSNSLAQVLRQTNLLFAKNIAISGFDGRAALQGTLGGTLDAPTLEAAVGIEDLEVGQVKAARLNSNLSYANQLVTVAGLQLQWKGQSLVADGSLNLLDNALDFTGHTANGRIEKLVTGPFTGAINAEMRVGGTVGQPTASISIAGSDLAATDERLGKLEAQATLTGNLLRINEMSLPNQGLRATGTYQVDTGSYTFEAQAPAMLLTYGTIAFTATGTGTVANPQLDLQLTATRPDYGSVKLAAIVRDHVADIKASAPKYDTTAAGQVSIDAPHAATFTLQANALPLELSAPLTGAIRATVTGQGELDHWQNGSASLTAEPLGVKWNNEAVTTLGPLLADFSGGTFTLKPIQFLVAGAKLSLDGSLPLDPKSTQGVIRVNGELALASLPRLIPDWQPEMKSAASSS